MRTPILVRDGSLFVMLDSKLIEQQVGDNVWEYTPHAPGLYRKAIVDFVGLKNGNFLVKDDGRFGDRNLRVWTNGQHSGDAALEVAVGEGLTIITRGERLVEQPNDSRRQHAYKYDTRSKVFSYRLRAGAKDLGDEQDLQNLVFTISRVHWFDYALPPDILKWLVAGAGAGLAAGWLLRK